MISIGCRRFLLLRLRNCFPLFLCFSVVVVDVVVAVAAVVVGELVMRFQILFESVRLAGPQAEDETCSERQRSAKAAAIAPDLSSRSSETDAQRRKVRTNFCSGQASALTDREKLPSTGRYQQTTEYLSDGGNSPRKIVIVPRSIAVATGSNV